jgi:SAM-dependent methyltransferase
LELSRLYDCTLDEVANKYSVADILKSNIDNFVKNNAKIMNEAAVREYFDNWSLYNQVIDHNYMFHDELYRELKHFIGSYKADVPIAILDLGCGSASHLSGALQGRLVGQYVGYDLSEVAISCAKRNLAELECPVEFRQDDLLTGLRANSKQFDLIFSSFALHHLTSTAKADFFRLAYESLPADGILLLIDVMREEDEDLEAYLENYCSWLKSEWSEIQTEGLDSICSHIQDNDFPERVSELIVMAAYAGFSNSFEINQFRWHRTMCFSKSVM